MGTGVLESFDSIRDRNLMILKEAKEKGVKVVGIYCSYGPRELVLAAGAIPVGLCGTRQEPIAAAETRLPANLCPLIKSSYGFALSDTCPYFHFSDLVIGETTCDGKKKMFELLQELKPVHVMHLPQFPTGEYVFELWYREMVRLKGKLEEVLDVEITDTALREAIHVVNECNRALKRLFDLNRRKPPVISGTDLVKVAWQIGFHSDRWERVHMLEQLVSELEEGEYGELNAPRILVTGTPIGVGSEKVVSLVEECGGAVVAMENCSGYKTVGLIIDEEDTRDPLMLLAEKYLRIPCSVMTPNHERIRLIKDMARDFQVDGVIDLTWQACHTYNIEAYQVAQAVKEDLGLPYLHLETDYSESDRESLRVRIDAFLEIVGNRK
ncbi:double-cubane-cluster-containing anaerobic reductase [Syntrophothermus lipocalidus]|uniref:2-hydroxyglutaryl-CoA dehydratase D-component n=1 Tax=Syntrophothermus lipocalidus (strain DSM 12680 / TGB-C1) TaxID=643648 RepID=D7CJY9_SYNLT|nr:double-cubane-cluster-containing anaerobic reductase [Syntrophothermus lipocalidus]ADI01103.1 2-hydroxyglutaryl-CoA dehydratase D-component [Syntrophothermus lipocalidus DSM 12680]